MSWVWLKKLRLRSDSLLDVGFVGGHPTASGEESPGEYIDADRRVIH